MKYKILFVLALLPALAQAQTQTTRQDSAATALRVKALKTQIEELNKDIAKEDSKRDRTILGVSPEQLEEMNERQDSICLELRSQLTDKELELKELTSDQTAAALSQQISNLHLGTPNTTPPRRNRLNKRK